MDNSIELFPHSNLTTLLSCDQLPTDRDADFGEVFLQLRYCSVGYFVIDASEPPQLIHELSHQEVCPLPGQLFCRRIGLKCPHHRCPCVLDHASTYEQCRARSHL